MGDVGVSTDQSPEQDFKLALAYKVRHLLSVPPHLQCEALFSNALFPVCHSGDPQSNIFRLRSASCILQRACRPRKRQSCNRRS